MTADVPLFGTPSDELPLVPRPGAYAVVLDEAGRVAAVWARSGPHLPGGGVDPGETHREALVREIAEEIAHDATVGRELGRADVHADSPAEGACFLKHGTFFVATLGAPIPSIEPEHEMEWMTPERFLRESPDPTHAWALRRALQGTS